MPLVHDVLVQGSALSFAGGFFGLSAIVLVREEGRPPLLLDCGHHTTRGLLLSALKARGLEPGDIGTVFLSHLHFDHVNNIDLFPEAEVLVSRDEWEYAASPHPSDLFVPVTIRGQLERHRLRLIDGEGEVWPGLRHRPAPGHTPGLQVLSFEKEDGARVTLANDAVKTAREAMSARPDMEFDTEGRGSRSIAEIVEGSDIIVPGHHPEIRRSPTGWTWDEPSRLELIIR